MTTDSPTPDELEAATCERCGDFLPEGHEAPTCEGCDEPAGDAREVTAPHPVALVIGTLVVQAALVPVVERAEAGLALPIGLALAWPWSWLRSRLIGRPRSATLVSPLFVVAGVLLVLRPRIMSLDDLQLVSKLILGLVGLRWLIDSAAGPAPRPDIVRLALAIALSMILGVTAGALVTPLLSQASIPGRWNLETMVLVGALSACAQTLWGWPLIDELSPPRPRPQGDGG